MPKRILYIHDGKMNNFGLDLVAAQQLQALSEAGYEIDLLARGGLDLPGVRSLTHRYTWANLVSWVSRPFYFDAKKRAIGYLARAQLRREDYTAVIGWIGGMLPLVREAQALDIPLLLNVPLLYEAGQPQGAHPDGERLSAWNWPRISQSERRLEYLGSSAELLLPSRHSIDVLQEAGVQAERLHLIERGFDPQNFYPADTVPTPFRLLFCGKLRARKGVLQALQAWREAALGDAEFWFAGHIPRMHEKQWRQAAAANVRFLGFRRDVGDVMRQCHAQILLSNDEGQAKSLIEGAACGLATVATRVTGFPFERGELGFAVSAEDVSAVATVLRRLRNERDLCRRMSAEAARVIGAHYPWPVFRRRFIEAVEPAIRRRARRSTD